MRRTICASKLRRRTRMQVELLEERQLLASITVNTTADDTTPDATMSLRQAIEVSNGTLPVSSLSTQEQSQVTGAVGASNMIEFNIPTTDSGYDAATGVWTIAVQSALPTIATNAAIINGYSQPGASKNTLAQGDNAKLAIAINGGSQNTSGLTIAQQGSQVFGLDIENFGKDGVLITAGGNVQVAGCFIGTDPTGETRASNETGVVLENSFNMIGGPNVGDRNVISGSGNSGTFVDDGIYVPEQSENPLNIEPTGNVIENNIIGLDATGTKSIRNEYAGVEDLGSGNIYGGTTAGLGNLISGNLVLRRRVSRPTSRARRRSSARRRLRWAAAALRFRSRRHWDHHRISSTSHSRTSSKWTSRARTSGTVICGSFFPQPCSLEHKERQRQHRERCMMVPTHPAAGLVFVEAAFSLGRLNVLFDRPPCRTHLC